MRSRAVQRSAAVSAKNHQHSVHNPLSQFRKSFTIGGRLPVNPSGGLESKGHPLGATGIGQLYELVTQLRGEAGVRQVQGACHAIQENGGGNIGVEEAAVAVHILSK